MLDDDDDDDLMTWCFFVKVGTTTPKLQQQNCELPIYKTGGGLHHHLFYGLMFILQNHKRTLVFRHGAADFFHPFRALDQATLDVGRDTTGVEGSHSVVKPFNELLPCL